MSHAGIICEVRVRKHPNANNLQIGECLGYQVLVGKEVSNGQLGIFFGADLQLGLEFSLRNNLLRKHPETGQPLTGYLEPSRRVRVIKLRGVNSEGLWLPVKALAPWANPDLLRLGEEITELNGVSICQKYESPATQAAKQKAKIGAVARFSCPIFARHYDTEHLRNNLDRIKVGANIVITEKLHGTSGRSANTKVIRQYRGFARFIRKLFRLPLTRAVWEMKCGTRNTILENPQGYRGEHHSKLCLAKGETIYYEIVGYTDNGAHIMPCYALNRKDPVDKEIAQQVAPPDSVIKFTYGCEAPESKIFVYRITLSNEDGHTVELPWYQVEQRCKDLGLQTAPVLRTLNFDETINLPKLCEELGSEPSVLDSRSVKEGVCVRVEQPGLTKAFKHKSFWFCHLEGIIKNDDNYVDVEEVS
jgi:hypothetical protein